MQTAPIPSDIRLVVSDMDGTLLDNHGQVPEQFWDVLAQLDRAGIVFAPASGRQYAALTKLFAHEPLVGTYIAENGSLVVRDGEVVSAITLPRGEVEWVITELREMSRAGVDLGVVLSTKDCAYVERGDDVFLMQVERYFGALQIVDDLLAVQEPAIKVAVFDFAGAERNVGPALAPHLRELQLVVAHEHWIDIMSPAVNKGVALAALQADLGITADQTMAFGDYLNDLELLAGATHSFAMANAHPAILQQAAYLAPSNTEHGVVSTLQALLATQHA